MLFVVTFGLITSFDVIADDYTCLQYIQAAIYKESVPDDIIEEAIDLICSIVE